ncbi:hypothetical protein [Chitinimonas sp.]|uniref:T4 family baseplate hub assembly chaperone n=1 Tax=Chitinimonas sp. TaxID=1934313 RepID=UPI002F95AAE3
MDTATLFTLWDQGCGQPPVQRALCLLAAAWPERAYAGWAEVSIGERDEYLLRLRERLFGQQLQCVATCPNCAQALELSFETTQIRASAPLPALPLAMEADGYSLSFRLPNSGDLLDALEQPESQRCRRLMVRCVMSASKQGEAVAAAQLPDALLAQLSDHLAVLDPQASVELALVCHSCAHQWSTLFDILSYLWGEIEDWGERLLLDIHALALAYGWSERDILALSPQRRQRYLAMIGA